MIFRDEIKQHSRFFLHRRVKILPAKSLVYLPDGTFKGIILLMGKPLASTEFLLQFFYGLHGSLVGSMKLYVVSGLLYRQLLIIVSV